MNLTQEAKRKKKHKFEKKINQLKCPKRRNIYNTSLDITTR